MKPAAGSEDQSTIPAGACHQILDRLCHGITCRVGIMPIVGVTKQGGIQIAHKTKILAIGLFNGQKIHFRGRFDALQAVKSGRDNPAALAPNTLVVATGYNDEETKVICLFIEGTEYGA